MPERIMMRNKFLSLLKRPFYLTTDSLRFNLSYALFTVIMYNGVFFKHAMAFRSDILFLCGLFICLWMIFYISATLLFHKYTRKPLAIMFTLLNAITFYFMFIYNAAIDKIMFLNMMKTDVYEVSDLLKPHFFLILFLMSIIPSFLIWKTKVISSPSLKHLKGLGLALLLTFAILLGNHQTTNDFLRNNRNLRYYVTPSNYIGALISVTKIKSKPVHELIKVAEDAKLNRYWKNDKKNLFIFVMGETARAANFSLRGYKRPTNEALIPYLNDIIYYENTLSCGTSTAVAVPCTFSVLERKDFKPGTETYTENLLDVMKRAGYRILWKENNTGCQDVCNRVEQERSCKTNTLCLDETMLDNLEEKISSFDSDAFIVLHQRGSHGPAYTDHYPPEAEKYTPVCQSKDFPYCSRQALINVYDNSIIYTSIFLAKTIDKLTALSDRYNTALIYISDHGESLGEKGLFLHAAPYASAPIEQKDIPFFIWLSDSFAKDFNIDKNCLRQHVKKQHSQDNIFHSILGLSGIETQAYTSRLDIFAPCRKK